MNLHKMIQIEADRLEKEVRELEKRLEKAPKGSLRCHKNGKNFRWYYIDEKDHREKEKNAKRKYISKRTGRSLAEKLARKAYDKKKLVGCKKELTALKRYLNCSNNEMMPTSVNNVQGVKSFILLYFVLKMIQQLETTTYIR